MNIIKKVKEKQQAKIQPQIDADRAKMFNRQERQKAAQYAAARNKDLAAGRDRGEQIFGQEALGRVNEQRSADVADIMNRRKEQLGGFTAEEQGAMRDNNMKAILQSQQAGSRDLARNQARSGVRGGLATAQQGAFAQQGQGQLADQERQLFLANAAERRGALDKFEQSTAGAESADLARQQYNQAQKSKELLGKLSTEFGYGSLGSAERTAAMQSILGDKAIAGSKDIAKATEGKK